MLTLFRLAVLDCEPPGLLLLHPGHGDQDPAPLDGCGGDRDAATRPSSRSAGVGNSPGSVPLFMVGDGRFQNYIIALLILRIFGYIFVFRLCSLILNSVVEPVPPERNRSGYDQNFGIIVFKEVQIVHA